MPENDTLQTLVAVEPTMRSDIVRFGKTIRFEKGETLFSGDDLLEHFYIVRSGKIKNYQLNLDNAKEQTIFIFRAGDMFDIFVLLDGEPHDVIYEGLEPGEVLRLPMAMVREMVDKNPEFRKRLFPYIAKQMRHVEELATDLSLYDTSTRLMKLILRNLDLKNPVRHLGLLQNLPHDEIASLIGTVRHVVNRHLQQLKKEGILNIERKKLAVNDVEKLLEKVEDEY